SSAGGSVSATVAAGVANASGTCRVNAGSCLPFSHDFKPVTEFHSALTGRESTAATWEKASTSVWWGVIGVDSKRDRTIAGDSWIGGRSIVRSREATWCSASCTKLTDCKLKWIVATGAGRAGKNGSGFGSVTVIVAIEMEMRSFAARESLRTSGKVAASWVGS